jgi:hypothetical protein
MVMMMMMMMGVMMVIQLTWPGLAECAERLTCSHI